MATPTATSINAVMKSSSSADPTANASPIFTDQRSTSCICIVFVEIKAFIPGITDSDQEELKI
ncbi:MAG: hypothetical protein AAGD25_36790 [Cyanobacteria bacterium P01_F01_bin.150]